MGSVCMCISVDMYIEYVCMFACMRETIKIVDLMNNFCLFPHHPGFSFSLL